VHSVQLAFACCYQDGAYYLYCSLYVYGCITGKVKSMPSSTENNWPTGHVMYFSSLVLAILGSIMKCVSLVNHTLFPRRALLLAVDYKCLHRKESGELPILFLF